MTSSSTASSRVLPSLRWSKPHVYRSPVVTPDWSLCVSESRSEGPTGQGCFEGAFEIDGELRLHDVAEAASGGGGPDELLVFMDGEEHDRCFRVGLPEFLRHVEPGHAGHRDVEDDRVRVQAGCRLQGRGAAGHRRNNLVLEGQRVRLVHEECLVVIDEKNSWPRQ